MAMRHALITRFYDKIILKHPLILLCCVLAAVSFLGYQARNFKLDASADTLIVQTDKDLQYSRLIESRYGEDDYLIITYTPKADLFSDQTLKKLAALQADVEKIERVSSVVSILNAPMLESPSLTLEDLSSEIHTLASSTVDPKSAGIEFANSPLYRNLLVSADLKTTALQIKFHPVSKEIQKQREKQKQMRHQDIASIRDIMEKHREGAELFLGGVSMISDDLIRFIKNDLMIFGLGVPFFCVVILSIIFKDKRWVFLPFLCCAFSIISMMGILGMFDWQVTVISSNFVSLQLIVTMAIGIHLTVRYRELLNHHPQASQRDLILDTVRLMITPCIYAALTTIAGFGSLISCDILPVITFGWMMSAGIMVSLLLTFIVFPSSMMLLGKARPQEKPKSVSPMISGLAVFTETHGSAILILSAVVFIISAFGISRLTVENSFINYFKEKTEIHQGMKVIDQKLGGTTPLDVIVEMGGSETKAPEGVARSETVVDKAFEAFNEFNETADESKYWFTSDKMAQVVKIHHYLDSLPETGKVLSLGTMVKIAEKRNDGKPLDNVQLAVLYSRLPKKYKRLLIKPYVSPEYNQLRFSVRIKDSEKTLNRNDLLNKIRYDLTHQPGLGPDQVHLTGLMVLYNNMLQSLFHSQIATLGIVILALTCMFLILFRSFKLAVIALVPNLLAISVVLGVMGWLKIPLDMMTITIAAISIGIGVDNTIHYIYRFEHEFSIDGNYILTLHRCHASIGYALSYTSLTIIIGFSILALSNFIPSIYFGLLTGLAMFVALIAALTLLPQLLISFSPFEHRL